MLKLLNVSQFINSPKQGGSMSAEVGQPAPELTLINNESEINLINPAEVALIFGFI